MVKDTEEIHTLVVEFRAFVVGTELKLENIERRLSKLTDNSEDFRELAQTVSLFQQKMEQEWKFHRARHAESAKEMKAVKKKVARFWPYLLVVVVLSVGGEEILGKIKSLVAF